MAQKNLSKRSEDRNRDGLSRDRRQALTDINDKFAIGHSVQHLQHMMRAVTDKELTADTVNAAVNCAQAINNTVKTAIQAAKFLAD